MPEMIATEKRQRVECVTWEAELTSVPPGAVRHVAPGMKPPCGFKKVLVLDEQTPEQNGVYFVPAIELLPPRERERAKRSQKRYDDRRRLSEPQEEEQMFFGLGSTGTPLGNGIAWSAPCAGIDVVVTFAAPDPAIASACERVRLFLAEADLTDQSVAVAREASQLRHRLRTPSPDVLRAAVLFLGGVYPARPGQAALVNELLHRLKPEVPHGFSRHPARR